MYHLAVYVVFCWFLLVFFFNDTATTEIYTLSLHDALPISRVLRRKMSAYPPRDATPSWMRAPPESFKPTMGAPIFMRSEEHTSELQSHHDLVCRLLLEKKKKKIKYKNTPHTTKHRSTRP